MSAAQKIEKVDFIQSGHQNKTLWDVAIMTNIIESKAGGALIAMKVEFNDELNLDVVVYTPHETRKVVGEECGVRFFSSNESVSEDVLPMLHRLPSGRNDKSKLVYVAQSDIELEEILIPKELSVWLHLL